MTVDDISVETLQSTFDVLTSAGGNFGGGA